MQNEFGIIIYGQTLLKSNINASDIVDAENFCANTFNGHLVSIPNARVAAAFNDVLETAKFVRRQFMERLLGITPESFKKKQYTDKTSSAYVTERILMARSDYASATATKGGRPTNQTRCFKLHRNYHKNEGFNLLT
uniref:Uncharacterized protein n=1 Tax=Syphacia muris TaxID=451379 RepID=A0A0N5AFP6_9BILA